MYSNISSQCGLLWIELGDSCRSQWVSESNGCSAAAWELSFCHVVPRCDCFLCLWLYFNGALLAFSSFSQRDDSDCLLVNVSRCISEKRRQLRLKLLVNRSCGHRDSRWTPDRLCFRPSPRFDEALFKTVLLWLKAFSSAPQIYKTLAFIERVFLE